MFNDMNNCVVGRDNCFHHHQQQWHIWVIERRKHLSWLAYLRNKRLQFNGHGRNNLVTSLVKKNCFPFFIFLFSVIFSLFLLMAYILKNYKGYYSHCLSSREVSVILKISRELSEIIKNLRGGFWNYPLYLLKKFKSNSKHKFRSNCDHRY